MGTKRRLLTTIGLTVALVAGSSAGVAQAAPTCQGNDCDYQDPMDSGCYADARTVESVPLVYRDEQVGKVDLRWSPACQTNWTRVTAEQPRWIMALLILDYEPGLRHQAERAYGDVVWSPMLYAPQVCAQAVGTLYRNADDYSDRGYAHAYTGLKAACD